MLRVSIALNTVQCGLFVNRINAKIITTWAAIVRSSQAQCTRQKRTCLRCSIIEARPWASLFDAEPRDDRVQRQQDIRRVHPGRLPVLRVVGSARVG
jgi:hypothetical protein